MTRLQNNKDLFSAAFTTHRKILNSYAFFKISNQALGADLVQDAFLRTWKYLVLGGKIDSMKAYLYRVLNGLIIDEYRKNKTLSLDVLLEGGYQPTTNEHSRLQNILDGRMAILLIDRLPVKYQKPMRMKYVQDLSLSEISLITGQSKNAIAVQLHRGLDKLKKLYKF